MANRYWVGGAGTWNTSTTTNWSATTGGAGGASAPTAADSVFFDQAGTYTVTCSTRLCLDLTVSAGVVTFSSTGTLGISGSMTLLAGTVWTNSGITTFNATATGKTITTNGVSFASQIVFNGVGGGWTLGSALTTTNNSTGAITVTAGTFSTSASNYSLTTTAGSMLVNGGTVSFNGSTVSCTPTGGSALSISSGTLNLNTSAVALIGGSLSFSGGTLNANSAIVTMSGSQSTPISFSGAGTFSAGTSQLIISSATGGTIAGNGNTFYSVSATSTTAAAAISILGANTFTNLSITAPTVGVKSVAFTANQTVTGTLTATGGAITQRVMFKSSSVGTTRTITTAAISIPHCDFQDITAAGAAGTWSGTSFGDCKGNTNITFAAAKTVYWNLSGAQLWSATGWATTAGGTPAAGNFPLAQDTATFTNTGSVTGTITISSDWNIGTLDMSGRTTAMTLSAGTGIFPVIYGNFSSGTGTILSGSAIFTFSGRNSQTILSNGISFTQSIKLDSLGGTLTLTDALSTSRAAPGAFSLNNGTINLNGKTLTISSTGTGSFDVPSSGGTRDLTFNGGSVVSAASGSAFRNLTSSGFTTTAGTGTGSISLTNAAAKTFQGNGVAYNCTLNQGGAGALTITGANTFTNITNTVQPATVTFPSSTITTVTNFSLTGTVGNLITINSSTAGTAATLSKASGAVSVSYLSIQDSTATGGATWTAISSTNVSGNTGWTFSSISTGNFLMFFF